MIGNAAGDGGEMRVRGGEQVQRDVRRKDFLRKRRRKKIWQTRLEDAQGFLTLVSANVSERCTLKAYFFPISASARPAAAHLVVGRAQAPEGVEAQG